MLVLEENVTQPGFIFTKRHNHFICCLYEFVQGVMHTPLYHHHTLVVFSSCRDTLIHFIVSEGPYLEVEQVV